MPVRISKCISVNCHDRTIQLNKWKFDSLAHEYSTIVWFDSAKPAIIKGVKMTSSSLVKTPEVEFEHGQGYCRPTITKI